MSSFIASLLLSLQIGCFATLAALICGIPIAYLLARKNFLGKELLDTLITLPLILPPTVIGYYLIICFGRQGLIGGPLYTLTGLSFMFNWLGAVLASFVVAAPLMIKVLRTTMESIDRDLIDASYATGQGEWTTFWRIILPLSRKGIMAGTLITFARAIGEFGATLMIAGDIPGRTETMPLLIYAGASSGNWHETHLLVLGFTVCSLIFLSLTKKLL